MSAPVNCELRERTSFDGDGDGLDRSFMERHFALASAALPATSDLTSLVRRLMSVRVKKELDTYEDVLDETLSDDGLAILNACGDEVSGIVAGLEEAETLSEESRTRAARIYGRRFHTGATVRDVARSDVFFGSDTAGDLHVIRWLVQDESAWSADDKTLLRVLLCHRWLHRPQRTSFIFLHECIVGHYLNALDNGTLLTDRRLIIGNMIMTYDRLPTYFLQQMSLLAGCSYNELLALHLATQGQIETALSPVAKDLLLACAHIYFCIEPFMNRLQGSGRIANGLIHIYFAFPAIERLVRSPQSRIVAEAGAMIDRVIVDTLYGVEGTSHDAHNANETDLISMLLELSKNLFVVPTPAETDL